MFFPFSFYIFFPKWLSEQNRNTHMKSCRGDAAQLRLLSEPTNRTTACCCVGKNTCEAWNQMTVTIISDCSSLEQHGFVWLHRKRTHRLLLWQKNSSSAVGCGGKIQLLRSQRRPGWKQSDFQQNYAKLNSISKSIKARVRRRSEQRKAQMRPAVSNHYWITPVFLVIYHLV